MINKLFVPIFLCISYRHKSGMKYGYARVSPGGKSESVDAQARQLTKAGCKKVFRDVHVSGAKTDRAQLRRVARGSLNPATC